MLEPPSGLQATDYWAPGVAFPDGHWFMYHPRGAGEEGIGSASGSPTLPRAVPRPAVVRGPGRDTVVQGPRGGDWLVCHAWDPARSARRMYIDRLAWGPDGPLASGPSAAGAMTGARGHAGGVAVWSIRANAP